MSYTPINWQTGQTITADKLNKMDNGWGVQNTQIFSETVTTVDDGSFIVGELTYSSVIDAPAITVTFNGTDYECTRIDAFDEYFYGGFTQSGPDFSVFPFAIESRPLGNALYTMTAGTYTVAASGDTIVVSDRFSNAVGQCLVIPRFTEDLDLGTIVCDLSFNELSEAVNRGNCLFAYVNDEPFFLYGVSSTSISFFKIGVTSSDVVNRVLYFDRPDFIRINYDTYPSA